MKSLFETKIYEGVRFDGKSFIFDYDSNTSDDLINFRKIIAYKSKLWNDVYYYGYQFRKDVPSNIRSKFINGIKGIDNTISQKELVSFIMNGLALFYSATKTPKYDCLIYPLSNRSNLVNEIVRQLGFSIKIDKSLSFEIVKNLPSSITIDYDKLEQELRPKYTEKQWKQILQNIDTIIDNIHKLDYFSIASSVKAKYRPYISNFLKFKTEKDKERFSKLKGPNVLIIDDINTSFSTLKELVNIARIANPESKITIFTLIGKNFE